MQDAESSYDLATVNEPNQKDFCLWFRGKFFNYLRKVNAESKF